MVDTIEIRNLDATASPDRGNRIPYQTADGLQTGYLTPAQILGLMISGDLTTAGAGYQLKVEAEGSVASASTCNIGTETALRLLVTGNDQIDSLGTVANCFKILIFEGELVFKYNGTSQILQGGADITTASGDMAIAMSDADGNWRVFYLRADGRALKSPLQPYVDVASAATCDIGAAASENVNITGLVTITSLGTAPAGIVRYGKFDGSLTLTNSAAIVLLTGADITTAAGDTFRGISLGSGSWIITDYQRADGTALTATVAPSVGVGQTWQDVKAGRAGATSYQNTTGKPIMVAMTVQDGNDSAVQVSSDNSTWISLFGLNNTVEQSVSFVVPDSWYYRVSIAPGSFSTWAELR